MKPLIHALFALSVISSTNALESQASEPFGICRPQGLRFGFILDLSDVYLPDSIASLPEEENSSSGASTHSAESHSDSSAMGDDDVEEVPLAPSSSRKKKNRKKAAKKEDKKEFEATLSAHGHRVRGETSSSAPPLNLDTYSRLSAFEGFFCPPRIDIGVTNKKSEFTKGDWDWPYKTILDTYTIRDNPDSPFLLLLDPKSGYPETARYKAKESDGIKFGFGDKLIRIEGDPITSDTGISESRYVDLIIKNASSIYWVGENGYSREEHDLFSRDGRLNKFYLWLLAYLNGIPAFEEVSPQLVRAAFPGERQSIRESHTFYYLAVRDKESEDVILVAVRNKPKFKFLVIQGTGDPKKDAALLNKFVLYFGHLPCLELAPEIDFFCRTI